MAQTKKVQEERIAELKQLGFELSADSQHYILGSTEIKIHMQSIAALSKDAWSLTMQDFDIEIQKLKSLPVTESENIEHSDASIEISKRNAESDIAKFDFNKAKIEAAKKEYMQLSVSALTDKENFKKLKDAKSVMRTARTTLEKRRKDLKEWYIAEGKKIDAYANECFSLIEPIESHLDAEIGKFDAWQKDADERKEREASAECDRRVEVIKSVGMMFNGQYYVIGDNISMDISTIKTMPLFDFEILTEKVKLEKTRLDTIAEDQRKEKERIEKEEQQKREQFEAEQRELKRQQDELAENNRKMNEERENMRRQKMHMRELMCKNISMVFVSSLPGFIFQNEYATVRVTKDEIETMADAEYATMIDDYTGKISEAKQKQSEKESNDRIQREKDDAERKERQQKAHASYMQRSSELISAGLVLVGERFTRSNEFNDSAFISVEVVKATSEDIWPSTLAALIDKVKEVNALTDSKRAQILKEKEALKPDIQRAGEYLQSILEIAAPKINSEKIQVIIGEFIQIIADASNIAVDKLKDCEL